MVGPEFGLPVQLAPSVASNSQSSTRAPPSPVEVPKNAVPSETAPEEPEEPEDISCPTCEKVIFDLEAANNLTKLDLIESRIFQCATCQQLYHHSCLDHCTPMMEAKIRGYEWNCSDCTLCTVCKDAGEEDQLLFCDACDRGYHMYCLEPEMKKLPKGSNFKCWSVTFLGSWLCEQCAVCSSCELEASAPYNNDINFKHVVAKGKDRDVYLTTLCLDCSKDFDASRYCPICLKTYDEAQAKSSPKKRQAVLKNAVTNDLIRCTECNRRVHYACDERAGEDREAPEQYRCQLCRLNDQVEDSDSEIKKKVLLPGEKKPAKKRGRPRKYPVAEILTIEEVRKRKKIRPRNVVEFKGVKIAAPLTKVIK
jgi:hypothetical protein